MDYFQKNPRFIKLIYAPLILLGLDKNFDISVNTWGGGLGGQAEAIL